MGGDAEHRTPAQRRGRGTRRAVADRVEALTQPVPGHELADVRFERRTVIGPRSARIMTATVAALVVVVGGVMLFSDSGGDGDGGGADVRGDVVAGLSPAVSGETGVELAGDTGGDDDATDDTTGGDREGPVVVSVQGLVHRPGLVTVDAGTRAGEVIDRTGGVRGDGRVEGINLAEPVVDGMQIVVDPEGSHVLYPGQAADTSASEPTGGAPGAGTSGPPSGTGAGAGTAAGLVDINTADATALTSLSGVGPATAEAIIAWRESHGAFGAVEQLMEVKGIGPAKFEALRDHVTV
ncbi:ComEA family DNA-binding protein [Corynebacterium sp.]|uniref:ComEA family DNA-binding protein n=1 Tax=Corynebacterium sp. TaxID=1720 RepID=UPI003B3B685D